MAKKKVKEAVWIIVGVHGTYVGFWYTRRDAQQGHIDHLGYMKWSEAYAKGDRCIKAILQYTV